MPYKNSRIIVDGIKDHAIISTDINGYINDWNVGAELIFGWKRNEVMGKLASLIFTPEDLNHGVDKEEMMSAATLGKAEDKRWHIKKNGIRFYANGIMNSLLDDTGKVMGFVKVLRDDTERIMIEDEKRRAEISAESRFCEIANTIPNIVWTARADGTIDWHNDKYKEYTGLSPWTVFDSAESPMHPDDLAITKQKWKASITSLVPFEVEHRLRRQSDGMYRWNLAKALPVIAAENNIKWVGSTTDIHDLKCAQENLKQSEEQFRSLANSLPLFIWTADSDFVVDWYNDWWYKYLGLPRGTKWDDEDTLPMHPDDVKITIVRLKEFVAKGTDFTMEQRFRRGSDGQYRWHLVSGVPIKNEIGKVIRWVGANVDIHDQKELLNQLEEEGELRERFVAALTHDLRTPLATAMLSAQLLKKAYTHDEYVTTSSIRISSNLDRVDKMIQDLLDATRITAGEALPINLEKVELSSIIHSTIDDLKHIHGNRFEVVEETKEVNGNWDGSGIRRIIENICNNAIKYGDADRPVTLTYGLLSLEMVKIHIHNYGSPIPAAHQKNLFEPFVRSESAQKSGKKGWGIGLMIVKGVVEAHGGYIEVKSDEHGTTFCVQLPVN